MISDGLRFSFIRTDGLLLTQFCHGAVSTFSRLKVNPFNCSNCPAVVCIGGQFRHYRKIHNVGHKLYINKPTPNVCRHSGSALVSCAFPTKSSHIIRDVGSTLSCYADISEHVRIFSVSHKKINDFYCLAVSSTLSHMTSHYSYAPSSARDRRTLAPRLGAR